jgi:hypothetical protein
MIDARTAATGAVQYLKGLYEGSVSLFVVEEAELTEDKKWWIITLSFLGPHANPFALASDPKEYKEFKIDSETGEIVWMKIKRFK